MDRPLKFPCQTGLGFLIHKMERLVQICTSQSWLHIKITLGGFRPTYAQELHPEILI